MSRSESVGVAISSGLHEATGEPRDFAARPIDILLALVCFLASLTLYTITLLPGNDFAADTMKYHFIGRILGLSHPPGSPLYILINWLVSQLPFGEQAWRINYLSALCGAAAVAMIYLVTRQVSRSRFGGLVAAAVLAGAQVFWLQAVIAEIYTPHFFMLTLSLYFILQWNENDAWGAYALACLFFGLSFGIHQMSAYFVPGFALFVFKNKGRILKTPRGLMATAAGALIGMSTYLYYAIRPFFEPQFQEIRFANVGDYFSFITGGYFRANMFGYKPAEMLTQRPVWLVTELLENFGPITLLLGIVGLVLLTMIAWRSGTLFLSGAGLSALFAMGYKVGDSQVFTLPALGCLAIGAGFAVGLIRRIPHPHLPQRLAVAALAFLVAVMLIADNRENFLHSFADNDMRLATGMESYAIRMLERMDRDGVFITSKQMTLFAVLYQEYIHGMPHHLIRHLHPGVWDGGSESLLRLLPSVSRRGNYYLSGDVGPVVEKSWGTLYCKLDVSRSLAAYFATIPEGKLLVLAARGEGLSRISDAEVKELEAMGISIGKAKATGNPYVAMLVRRGSRFTGIQRTADHRIAIDLKEGDELVSGVRLSVAVMAGAQHNACRITSPRERDHIGRTGMAIDIFDLFSGRLVEEIDATTIKTGSIGARSMYVLSPFQPAWRRPIDREQYLNNYLKLSGGVLRFGLKKAGAQTLTVSLLIVSRGAPNVTLREWSVNADGSLSGGEERPAELISARPEELATHERRPVEFVVQVSESDRDRMIEINLHDSYKRVEGILHAGPLLKPLQPNQRTSAGAQP